mgnify:CR=1 FL=1
MKIGVSSYSFSKLVKEGQVNQLELIQKAKDMGFDIMEFSTLAVPEGESKLSFASKLREECERVGIEVGNYTIGADFLRGSGGDWKKEVERLKKELRIAKELGAPGMRHDATRGFPENWKGAKGFGNALPILTNGCCAVTEFAQGLGIKTMVENHGFFFQDSDRVEMLINAVDHSNFGALIDMGNFLCVDEDPGKAMGKLMPYAFHVHAKDFHIKSGNLPDPGFGWLKTRGGNYLRGAIIGHGDVEILRCLKVMKKSEYQGVISIEFEGLEAPLEAIAIGLENLKYMINLAKI